MLRFTIRDLLWLMAVVGMALVLLSEHRQRSTETEQLRQTAEQHRKETEHWRRLSEAQLKAFHIEQSNMQAARVHKLEEVHRRLQEMSNQERRKVLHSLSPP